MGRALRLRCLLRLSGRQQYQQHTEFCSLHRFADRKQRRNTAATDAGKYVSEHADRECKSAPRDTMPIWFCCQFLLDAECCLHAGSRSQHVHPGMEPFSAASIGDKVVLRHCLRWQQDYPERTTMVM